MHSERLAYIEKLNREEELSREDVQALIDELKQKEPLAVGNQSSEGARLGFGEIEKHPELLGKVKLFHFSGMSPAGWSELVNEIQRALVRERNDSYMHGYRDGQQEPAVPVQPLT